MLNKEKKTTCFFLTHFSFFDFICRREYLQSEKKKGQMATETATTMIIITSDSNSNTSNIPFLSHLSKRVKLCKKSKEMVCRICGDRAIGYNYDVLSCASCKSFFYRNINRSSICITGRGDCSVSHEVHRKCAKCRFERCLTVGMRKDFVLSQQQKQIRFKKYFEKKNSATLNEHEWLLIENIRKSYLQIFREEDDLIDYSKLNVADQKSALILWSQIGNATILKVIRFVQQIEQFNQLNNDDRFILIKYNLLSLFSLTKCAKFNLKYRDFIYAMEKTTDIIMKRIQFYVLCFESDGLRNSFLNLVCCLLEITEEDPIILSLLLLIILFSQGISMNENEPSLHQSIDVYRTQSYYVEILHKYLIQKQGEFKTYQQFIRILHGIFQIQLITKKFLDFFRCHYLTNETVDRVDPLMQSILHIP